MVLILSPHNVVKKTYVVNNFNVNENNKLEEKHAEVYSQGINVSLMLKILQTEPFLLTIFGGINGKHIKNHLHVNKIKSDSIHVNKNTYEKIKIFDKEKNTVTVIKDSYMSLDDKLQQAYLYKYKENLKRVSLVLIDDRARFYLKNEILLEFFNEAKENNVRVFMDIKSKYSVDDMTISPYTLKMTRFALEQSNVDCSSYDNLKEYALRFIENGVHYVIFDLYEEGVYVFNKKRCIKTQSIEILDKANRVPEATDAFIAGFLTGISKGYEEERTIKLAYSASLAATNSKAIPTLSRKDVFDLRSSFKLKITAY